MDYGSAFIGRAPELELIAAQACAARRGTGGVVLISGEPGIGKSRLAEQAAARAATAGMRIARARVPQDEGFPPYWVFRQLLGQRLPEQDPVSGPGGQAERRFALFEHVRESLTGIAAECGLVVMLDDVHWADAPSLRLIRHLASGITDSRLLLLITYRDTETGGRPELTSLLAALAPMDAVHRVRLIGLSHDEVACQLVVVAGHPVAPELATAISRRTHGNPFFVAELGRLLGSRAGSANALAAALPEAVRDTVRARLDALAGACRAVLCAAAVLSADIDPAAVAAVTGRDATAVLTALDEAAAAGMVTGEGGWRFRHELIRETASLELPTASRLAVHAAMAGYLRQRPNPVPAVVAHHLLESLPVGDAAEAAYWAEMAARAAMSQLAWEDAVPFYRRALTAAGAGPAVRCRLLTGLGAAQLHGFDLAAGSATLRDAATAAREAADPALIGEVALATEGFTDPAWVSLGKQLCDEALAGLPDADSPQRARLLAMRAGQATYRWEPDAVPLSEQALAMAERLADPAALRSALRARQLARAAPDGVHERLALGARMLALGEADGDADAQLWGRLWRVDALAQLGRVAEAEAELLVLAPLVDRLRSPGPRWHLWRSQAALALGRGQFSQARQLIMDSLRITASAHENMTTIAGVVLLKLNGLTGRDEWLAPELADFSYSPPLGMAIRAWWHLTHGRPDQARGYYRPAEGLAHVPGTRLLVTYSLFAELAAGLGDQQTAARAHQALLPYADLFCCSGAGLTIFDGSVSRYLGITAAATGNLDQATRHLRQAIAANDRAGLAACTAVATFDLAQVLARRRRPGDRDEAAALAAVAADQAGRLGMALVSRDARALAGTLAGRGGGPLTQREAEIAALVARGLTNRQISSALHISERTAENHVQHILAKLGLRTRTQIALALAPVKPLATP